MSGFQGYMGYSGGRTGGQTGSQGGGSSQYSGGGVDDFFEKVMGKGSGFGGSVSDYAKSKGYSPNTKYGFSKGKFSMSESMMKRGMQRDTMRKKGGIASQLIGALLFDTERQDAAANEHYEKQQASIGQFGEALDQNVGDIKEQGEASQLAFQEIGAGLEEQGKEGMANFEKGVRTSRKGIMNQIGKAEASAQAAVTGLKDRTNIDASNAAYGINARVRSQTDRINSDPNMTPAQKQDALFQATQGGIREQGTQINAIKGQFNQQKAGLQMAVAQISSAGAGQLAGFEGSVQGARVGAQGISASLFQAGSAMRAQGESVRTAAINTAAQFELSGRQAMFEMISNSPRGVISVFAGLTSLLGSLTLPGIGQMPALQLQQGSLGYAGANA